MLDKNACIMVVDDMGMMRKSIIKFLKALGYTNFIEAENGAEAISKYKSNNPDFTFMDVVMPNKDGYEALTEIRKMDGDAVVAMLTSVADDDTLSKCLGQGAIGFIHKPLTQENGTEKLSAILEKVA